MASGVALGRLLNPKTIAVFGGDDAEIAIHQCLAAGFKGEIWPVNPHRDSLGGLKCFRSIAELPVAPDASLLAVPPQVAIEISRKLSQAGAGGAVCFTAGFAETGPEGAVLQEQLLDAAGDMPVLGPNCHGFLNYFDDAVLWPDQHGGRSVDRGAALVLQSGNLGINLSMQKRGLDLGLVITVGNKLNIALHEIIDFLASDERVSVIGLHIEGIEDVAAFSRACARALRAGVPIIAIKTGRSNRGAELTLSHTGSLSGSDRLYSALFDRLGIARCDTIAQFLETLKFLDVIGVLPEPSMASMSCSGGEASLVADHAAQLGLSLPTFSESSVEELQDALGSGVHICNPLDYHTYAWGDYDRLFASFSAVLNNDVACSVLVLDYPSEDPCEMENWHIAERALTDARDTTNRKAAIVSTLPETFPESARSRLLEARIPPMQGIEECLFAIRAAAFIGLAQDNENTRLALQSFSRLTGPVEILDEWQSKSRLGLAGIPIPRGRLCNEENCIDAANDIGYPVAVKAVSDSLAHKTEAGAVAISLSSAAEVEQAVGGMKDRFDRFLVEEMVSPVIAEVVVGITRDPTFGMNLLIGSGGSLVELMDDTVSLLLPTGRTEIARAIKTLKVSRLIDSYRGAEAGDREALIDAIATIAQYAVDNQEALLELEINPLAVLPGGVVALDAVMRESTGKNDAAKES